MHEAIKILQEIANNTASDNTVLIAAITASSAILGASISALISYFVTKRSVESNEKLEGKKLRANIVTVERLRWLQDMRLRLSDLYVQLDMQYVKIKQPLNIPKADLQNELNEYSSNIMLQVNMITLMLSDKGEQLNLKSELQGVLGFMQQCFQKTTSSAQNFDDPKYSTMKTNIFNYATAIGSETWRKISDLE